MRTVLARCFLLALALLALGATGCSLSRGTLGASPRDGGVDAFIGADANVDAARDDAAMDPDTGIDAAMDDGGVDMGVDAFVPPVDMGTDAFVPPVDAGTDAWAPDMGVVFPPIGGLTLVLDERGQITGGSGLTSWQDQSGLGHDFTQSSGVRRPTTGTVSGWSAVQFNGSTDLEGPNWGTLFGTTEGHMWIVIDNTGATPGPDGVQPWLEDALVSCDSSGGIEVSWTASGVRGYGYDTMEHVTPFLAAAPGLHLIDIGYNGATFSIRLDAGVPQGAGVTSPLRTFGTIGRLAANNDLTHRFRGRIASVIAMNRGPTVTEIQMIRDYLGAKYGVAH